MQESSAEGTFSSTWKRKNGFDRPATLDQIFTAIAYGYTIAMQFIVILFLCQGTSMISFVSIHSGLTAFILIFWFIVSNTDPECLEIDKPIPTSSNIFGQSVERTNLYCSQCRKKVYGMDHHCMFLNNCIGLKNYTFFLLLLIVAAIQTIMNIAIGIDLQLNRPASVIHHESPACKWSFDVLFGLHIAISGLIAMAVSALLGLHVFLNFIAMKGTYNWVLFKRQSRTDYSPPRLEEDSPSIMGEISNSFSSHMFRNSHRSRNYSSPRRRNPLEDLEENIVPGAESRSINSQSLMDSSRASSKKTRLYRSELLKSKHSTGAIYPESPESRSPLAAQATQDFSLIPSIEERETSHQAVVDLSLPRFSTSNRPTNHHFLS